METDHIVPIADGGDDNIDNAVAVCFECHAEIHSYNDQHPRGRKFRPEELRLHKEQWLKLCQEQPEVLVVASRASDVGPLQALIDELELNQKVAAKADSTQIGSTFRLEQLLRAIHEGSIAILRDEIKDAVLDAYVAMDGANQLVQAAWAHPKGSGPWANGITEAQKRILEARNKIQTAKSELLRFLSTDRGAT